MDSKMFLYLLEQDVLTGMDVFESAVVCAEDEKSARLIHPTFSGHLYMDWDGINDCEWPDASEVRVTKIGDAASGLKRGCICASYTGS